MSGEGRRGVEGGGGGGVGGGSGGAAKRPPRMFTCALCRFSSPYVYYGRNPKMAPRVVFLEDSYIANDPFSPEARPLCLGSKCTVCGSDVCTACSVFYTRRVCAVCAKEIAGHVAPGIGAVFERLPAPPSS